jgi:hypothetical protein
MPDFTVIEGGGQPDAWKAERAQAEFGTFVIELLRALARGEDHSRRVSEALADFLKAARETQTNLSGLVHDEIAALAERALAQRNDGTLSDERKEIVRLSMRVAAEAMARDPAAKGRLSSREGALMSAIEDLVLSREGRSRANGWSYLDHLTRHLEPWPPRTGPSSAPRASPKRKRRAAAKAPRG